MIRFQIKFKNLSMVNFVTVIDFTDVNCFVSVRSFGLKWYIYCSVKFNGKISIKHFQFSVLNIPLSYLCTFEFYHLQKKNSNLFSK